MRPIQASLLMTFVLRASLIVTDGDWMRTPSAAGLSPLIPPPGVLIALDSALRSIPSILGALTDAGLPDYRRRPRNP